jgi:hypothetical protein
MTTNTDPTVPFDPLLEANLVNYTVREPYEQYSSDFPQMHGEENFKGIPIAIAHFMEFDDSKCVDIEFPVTVYAVKGSLLFRYFGDEYGYRPPDLLNPKNESVIEWCDKNTKLLDDWRNEGYRFCIIANQEYPTKFLW